MPREVRQSHLDLTTPCDLDPKVKPGARRHRLKRDLLRLLNLENDVPNWRDARLCLTHQCEHHSLNGCCSNPLHVSFGTWVENQFDVALERRVARGRKAGAATSKSGKHRENGWGSAENNSLGGRVNTSFTWVCLFDGFVGTCLACGRHAESVGQPSTDKVKLSAEQVSEFTPRLEELVWKVPRKGRPGQFRKNRAKRVPLDVLENLRNSG